LALEGFQPLVDMCARCGDDAGPFPGFDLDEGGVLCESCTAAGRYRLDPAAAAVLGDLLGGPGAPRPAPPPAPPPPAALERLAIRSLEYHSERRLRSAALL